jgi:lactoylglutathione lyase
MNSKSKLNFKSFVLFVSDIDKSNEFYRKFLNEEIEHNFVTNISFHSGLALWQIKPDQEIIRQLGTKASPGTAVNCELYYETEDIQGNIELLKQRKVKFLHEIIEENWGQRTIRFFDPDGYLIEIGESMKGFVGRMHSEGLSSDQIVTKTGIPTETVREYLD